MTGFVNVELWPNAIGHMVNSQKFTNAPKQEKKSLRIIYMNQKNLHMQIHLNKFIISLFERCLKTTLPTFKYQLSFSTIKRVSISALNKLYQNCFLPQELH